tara:strand:- start:767 stop:1168 length:402 start_codon:yes stop_codon:yes gene_type:complete
MTKRTPDQIEQDILRIEEMTNETTDRIDREETKKENEIITIEKESIAYHKLKVSDLPMYKVYEGYKCKWYFKLEVVDGKQLCLKITDDEISGMKLEKLDAKYILDIGNQSCREVDWILATAKVLNYMSPNINK